MVDSLFTLSFKLISNEAIQPVSRKCIITCSVELKLGFIKRSLFLGYKQMKNEKKMDPRKMMMRNQGNVS